MFEDRTVVGLVEMVLLNGEEDHAVLARIDTGATRSSIDENLLENLEHEEAGTTRVKSSHGVTERRLVRLSVRIEKRKIRATFSVIDRNHMTYPVLIGQNILKKDFIIDPQKPIPKTEVTQ